MLRPYGVPLMPMAKRVLLETRDLLFRSKLGAVVAAAGADVSRDEAACDLAVIELGGPGATERIGELARRGIPVLAYGSHVHAELKRRGVTLALLWQEYRAEHARGYAYSWFCERYGDWRKCVTPTMRQTHLAGEKLFVD